MSLSLDSENFFIKFPTSVTAIALCNQTYRLSQHIALCTHPCTAYILNAHSQVLQGNTDIPGGKYSNSKSWPKASSNARDRLIAYQLQLYYLLMLREYLAVYNYNCITIVTICKSKLVFHFMHLNPTVATGTT